MKYCPSSLTVSLLKYKGNTSEALYQKQISDDLSRDECKHVCMVLHHGIQQAVQISSFQVSWLHFFVCSSQKCE